MFGFLVQVCNMGVCCRS